jgi:hypothetical protein
MQHFISIPNNRTVYKQQEFDAEFSIKSTTLPASEDNDGKKIFKIFKYPIETFFKLFAIFGVIKDYNIKKDLMGDFISGLTLGIIHMPAALAISVITSLSPVFGVYTSFYSGLIYALFGTSKHLSVGSYAVIALMVYSVIQRLEIEYVESNEFLNLFRNNSNNTLLKDENIMQFRIKVSACLTFWCGIVQVNYNIYLISIFIEHYYPIFSNEYWILNKIEYLNTIQVNQNFTL